MGLFDRFKKHKKGSSDWTESIKLLVERKITIQQFVDMNADQTVYCSTPVGETVDGRTVVWIKQKNPNDVGFYPAFLSAEYMLKSFSEAGRKDPIIIKGTLKSTLASLDSDPNLKQCGLLIEDEEGQLAIPPGIR